MMHHFVDTLQHLIAKENNVIVPKVYRKMIQCVAQRCVEEEEEEEEEEDLKQLNFMDLCCCKEKHDFFTIFMLACIVCIPDFEIMYHSWSARHLNDIERMLSKHFPNVVYSITQTDPLLKSKLKVQDGGSVESCLGTEIYHHPHIDLMIVDDESGVYRDPSDMLMVMMLMSLNNQLFMGRFGHNIHLEDMIIIKDEHVLHIPRTLMLIHGLHFVLPKEIIRDLCYSYLMSRT